MENLAALKVIAAFGANLGEEIESALSDGKLDLADAPKFFPSLMGISNLIEAVKAKPSFGALTEAELVDLKTFFAAELNLANDKLELVIESSIAVAVSIVGIISMAKALKKVEAAPAV